VSVQEGAVECPDRHREGQEPRDRATSGRQHLRWLHSMRARPPKSPDNFLKVSSGKGPFCDVLPQKLLLPLLPRLATGSRDDRSGPPPD
jgi:hypothetical protein